MNNRKVTIIFFFNVFTQTTLAYERRNLMTRKHLRVTDPDFRPGKRWLFLVFSRKTPIIFLFYFLFLGVKVSIRFKSVKRKCFFKWVVFYFDCPCCGRVDCKLGVIFFRMNCLMLFSCCKIIFYIIFLTKTSLLLGYCPFLFRSYVLLLSLEFCHIYKLH